MSLALLFHYLMFNMFRMLIRLSSGVYDLCVELFHGLYCSVRIEVFALAYIRIPHHTTPAKPQRNTNTHLTSYM